MANQQGRVPTYPGHLYMPGFDKILMGNNPAAAGFSLFYHLTEQHVMSQQLSKLKLIMFVPDVGRQHQRFGSGNIDIFNRGYAFYQLQVQEGRHLNLTTWELGKQVVFNIEPNSEHNFIQTLANKFSWANGFMWTYNVPLQPTAIHDQRDPKMRSLLQCLQYSGGEVLAKLPTATNQHIAMLLNNLHPMIQQKFNTDFQYYGANTSERIRGNPNIWAWISSDNYEQRIIEWINNTNKYREGIQQEDDSTAERSQVIDGSQQDSQTPRSLKDEDMNF